MAGMLKNGARDMSYMCSSKATSSLLSRGNLPISPFRSRSSRDRSSVSFGVSLELNKTKFTRN